MTKKPGKKNLLGSDPAILKFKVPRETYKRLERMGEETRRAPSLVARDIVLTHMSKEA